jgi:hypothetical protein
MLYQIEGGCFESNKTGICREDGKTASFDFQLAVSYRLPFLPAKFDF